MTKTLTFDTLTGNVIGINSYAVLPNTLPSDQIECTESEAGAPIETYQVVNGQLVASLTYAKTSQIAALRTACANAITGGFTSSALGSLYNYPSDPLSQSNMNTVAGSPSGGSLWCESGGVWAMKAHTQSQAQAVLAAFVAWLNSCQSQLVTLTGEVTAATTVAAVQAVVWVNP